MKDSAHSKLIRVVAEALGFHADDDDPITWDWWVFFPLSGGDMRPYHIPDGVQSHIVGCYDRPAICENAAFDEDSAWQRAEPYLVEIIKKFCKGDEAMAGQALLIALDTLED